MLWRTIVTLRQSSTCGCTVLCELTITQSLCLKISIEYGATAQGGDISVCCKKTLLTAEQIDTAEYKKRAAKWLLAFIFRGIPIAR